MLDQPIPKGDTMKVIFFITGAILALTCTAAVVLTPAHHPGIAPATTSDIHTLTPLPSDLSVANHSVPDQSGSDLLGTLPPGITAGPQSDGTCIHCGPGDNVCKAPGDCGYGDNPGSKNDGIPNNDDH